MFPSTIPTWLIAAVAILLFYILMSIRRIGPAEIETLGRQTRAVAAVARP